MTSPTIREKILIVEDDTNLGFFLKLKLEESNFSVTRVKLGKDGVKESMKNIYSLFLVDIGLPDISGFEVIKQIREYNQLSPIIVITDQITDINEINTFNTTANVFHKKPINTKLLVAQIKSLLFKLKKGDEITIGNIKIDRETSTITNGSEVRQLSKTEFHLLSMLMRSSYRIFEKEDILEKVMDRSKFSDDGAIDTMISRVRKKLKELGHPDFIKTVHGVGYTINPSYR